MPYTVVAGASQAFTWIYTAIGGGPVDFKAKVRNVSRGAESADLAMRVLIIAPSKLSASMVLYSRRTCLNQDVLLTLTVTNTGTNPVNGVFPGTILDVTPEV